MTARLARLLSVALLAASPAVAQPAVSSLRIDPDTITITVPI